LPAPANPLGTYVQIQTYNQLCAMAAAANAGALQHWSGQCAQWLQNAAICRGLGIALPAKPSPQPLATLLNNYPVPPNFGEDLWVWETQGPPLGSPCPDLAPLPTPLPLNTPLIGINVGGSWYQALIGDTVQAGVIVTVAANGSWMTSAGTSGTGLTCPAGTYEAWACFGGNNLYLKLS
jgi:hypothetical protein